MKNRRIRTAILSLLWLAASCAAQQKPDEATLYVSIPPLKEVVGGIVGDDFRTEVLVPPGASPETYEPTPRQFIGLNRAQLIFNVGLLDFETALLRKIDDRQKIVNLSRGIEPIAGSCSHGDHGGHHTHGVDPHVWTSPRALQRMAANAYEAIHAHYPDSAKYTKNYESLQRRLQELDERTAERIERSGTEYFIIYHPALTYYARDYGIEQLSIEHEGKEPSARRLAELQAKGEPAVYDTVLADILRRDEQDTHRAAAPLRKAPDAVLLDTTALDFEGSFAALKALVLRAAAGQGGGGACSTV